MGVLFWERNKGINSILKGNGVDKNKKEVLCTFMYISG